MATVRLVPVLTSALDFPGGIEIDELPAAPPTESSDSTSGTPAANMVASVLVQRAMVALRITSPKMGALSKAVSMNRCTFGERLPGLEEKYRPTKMTPKMMYQYLTKKSEIAITNRVGAGRSAPKLLNTSLNAGTTQIMITAVTTKATTRMETG